MEYKMEDFATSEEFALVKMGNDVAICLE